MVLAEIAAGLGDEYTDTREQPGRCTAARKVTGVITIDDGTARVVIEMTDSRREGWPEYLREAERNRQAVAALGLVRTAEQNGGSPSVYLDPGAWYWPSTPRLTTRIFFGP